MSKFALLLLLLGCQTTPVVTEGVQADYEAINPARILAIPPVVIPNPAEHSIIDIASVESAGLIPEIEKQVLSAFKNQPMVNGVSFDSVRKSASSMGAYAENVVFLNETRKKLNSDDSDARSKLADRCQTSRTFLAFYSFCVRDNDKWIAALNKMAVGLQNADSGLFIFVNHADKRADPPVYKTDLKMTLCLLDLNNGKVIWARSSSRSISNTLGKPISPDWNLLVKESLNEEFWQGFPGRKNLSLPPTKETKL